MTTNHFFTLAQSASITQTDHSSYTMARIAHFVHCAPHRLSFAALILFIVLPLSNPAIAQTLVIDINAVGLNTNQTTASEQLNQACATLNGAASVQATQLQGVCDLINSLDANDPNDVARLQEITDAVAPEEVFALNDSLIVISDYQTTNVHARLNALRSNLLNSFEQEQNDDVEQPVQQSLVLPNSFDYGLENQVGGGAAADLVSPFGVFVNGHISDGVFDGGRLQQNADIASSSLTIGGDYRFGANVVAGLGVGFIQDETRFNRIDGGTQSDGFNITAFATWYETDQGYLDVVLDLGRSNYELERSVSIDPQTSLIANSFPTAQATSLTVGGGRNFKPFGLDLGGYFRISYTGATIDGYSESLKVEQPGFAALFSIDDQSVVSTESVVGLNLTKAISLNSAVILPLLRIEYVNENNRAKDAIEATLISTGTVAQYEGEQRVASYSNLGLGASAVFRGGRSAYAYYETHLQHDVVSQDWLKAGVRLEF